jgi:hypothetical protein
LRATTGNPATYGATNNSTWLSVSPDTVNIELGNHFYVQSAAPFTGAIADFKLFTNALSGATLANIDASNAPTPCSNGRPPTMGRQPFREVG